MSFSQAKRHAMGQGSLGSQLSGQQEGQLLWQGSSMTIAWSIQQV